VRTGKFASLRRGRRGRLGCLRWEGGTSSGDEQKGVRIAGGRYASTQTSIICLLATDAETAVNAEKGANCDENSVSVSGELRQVYVSLEGDMQVPNRAPSTYYTSLEADMQVRDFSHGNP
jgi:hypothetical protein